MLVGAFVDLCFVDLCFVGLGFEIVDVAGVASRSSPVLATPSRNYVNRTGRVLAYQRRLR